MYGISYCSAPAYISRLCISSVQLGQFLFINAAYHYSRTGLTNFPTAKRSAEPNSFERESTRH